MNLRWRGNNPIFVGPFRTETGFEALYWLPWLMKWRKDYQIDGDRLIALSRGGAGYWYQAGRVVELYDYLPLQDLRLAMLQDHMKTESVKHLKPSAWEWPLLKLLAGRLGIPRYQVMHPSMMYNALEPWWGEKWSLKKLLDQLEFTAIPTPPLPVDLQLPERFVAVRFYQRPTWPLTDETRDWTLGLVQAIAQHIPVVVIGSTAYADTHVDFPLEGPNITSVVDYGPLNDNLAFQSAVIAKSQAFVGTYGGLMQLAVRLGKPSAGFYLQWNHTAYAHKILTEYLGVKQQIPVFIGRPQEADFVRQICPVALEIPTMRQGSSSGVTR